MEITHVDILRAEDKQLDERSPVKALATIVFDRCFAVKGIKIILANQRWLMCMPSRNSTDKCPTCGKKNYCQANFCNRCGKRLSDSSAGIAPENLWRYRYTDICHPTNTAFRMKMEQVILQAYHQHDPPHDPLQASA